MLLASTFSFMPKPASKPADGLYLVKKSMNSSPDFKAGVNEAVIFYYPGFNEDSAGDKKCLLINTTGFVKLDLESDPAIGTDKRGNKVIYLQFSREASEDLERFTTTNLFKDAVVVVDGRALTVKKIRAVIHSGKMEISGCNDSDCDMVYHALRENVRVK